MRWLKKKRRVSHLWRGFSWRFRHHRLLRSLSFPALSELSSKPSAGLLRSIAQIGGALLIAWTIQTALAMRESHYRNAVQGSTLGALMGSTACGLLGIVISLGLSERAEVGHWIWIDRLAFSLAASSLFFLGICLVLLSYFTYEWFRQGRIDPPE